MQLTANGRESLQTQTNRGENSVQEEDTAMLVKIVNHQNLCVSRAAH